MQPDLRITVSADSGQGGRQSFIAIRDEAGGIAVDTFDVDSGGNFIGPIVIASGLSYSIWHTVRVEVTFKDGPDNDVAEYFVDGISVHTEGSWEQFYSNFQASLHPRGVPIQTLLYRLSGPAVPAVSGNGYYIDDVGIDASSDTALLLRAPTVLGPAEPIRVYVDLTTGRELIASVGSRLTYDSTEVSFVSMQEGSAVPSSWSFAYAKTSTAGEIDFVLTDQTAAAATIAGPASALEVLCITFQRVGVNCTAAAYSFNSAPPDPMDPAAVAAFPVNHYIHYVDSTEATVDLEAASTTGVSGPAVDDHGFIRGNVNNRSAHVLDLGDVNDLANALFAALARIPCAAAYDTNNDGMSNITDLVTLVQGIFNSADVTIRPPNFANPGLGIPGVVVPDGGMIPSILGCADGETCP